MSLLDLESQTRFASRRRVGVAFAFMAACASVSVSGAARADAVAAEALFLAGKERATRGDIAGACPKFEASYRLDKTLGTLLNLADCHEKLGRIATAWAEWGEAHDRAVRAGDDRADYTRGRRDALAPRLPRLIVSIRNPRPGLEISRDGSPLDPEIFGIPVPVDPGEHRVIVTRGGTRLAEQVVVAAESAVAEVEVDLAAVESMAPPPGPRAPAPTTAPTTVFVVSEPSATQASAGLIIGGLGLAALGVGAGLGVAAISERPGDTEPAACVDHFCTPSGLAAMRRAETLANVGQWVAVGGLVFTAVGLTLVLSAPSAPQLPPQAAASAATRVVPWVGPGGGGLVLRGAL